MGSNREVRKMVFCVTNDLTYDQRMIRICRTMAEAGNKVLLVGRKRSTSISLKEEPFLQHRLNCRFDKGKWFYIEYNLRLLWFLLWHSTDLICAIDLDTIVPCWIAGRLRGRTLVYDAHEYFTEVPEVVDRKGIKWIWTQVAAFCIPRFRNCYTVGPQLAKIFQDRYKTPFSVIRNVPFPLEIPPAPRTLSKMPILLYQGALNEGRGLEALIDAMPQLPACELWLAGEGDRSEDLRAQVASLPKEVRERIQFLGFLRPEALREITLKADVGFNLLENRGLSYYYSLANKAFDYLQAGLPSVQMAFPEYQAIQSERDVFILLEKLEAKVIAEAVQSLLDHPDRYQRLSRNCLQAGEQFNWAKEAQKLLAFYSNLQR